MQKRIWINHLKAVLESSPGIDFWNCLKPVWEADWMAPLEIVLSDMPQPFLVHLLRPSVGQVWWRSARPTINTASELVLCFSPTNWICTWLCHGRFSLLFRDVIQKSLTRNSWWMTHDDPANWLHLPNIKYATVSCQASLSLSVSSLCPTATTPFRINWP